METAMKPVQNGHGRKRRWPAQQKLTKKRDYLRSILQPVKLKASYLSWGQMSRLIFGPVFGLT
jgi:hypothetical protein